MAKIKKILPKEPSISTDKDSLLFIALFVTVFCVSIWSICAVLHEASFLLTKI